MGEKNSGIKTAAEFRQEILNKWNTEYLPNIKELDTSNMSAEEKAQLGLK